ncbi:hypothetical protein [Xylophilus ampelinus]|nr:hypothetical protein [Xylophilus ampelinus]MCS4510977.1 hypothetical protein [Xylophilus ampelinus]
MAPRAVRMLPAALALVLAMLWLVPRGALRWSAPQPIVPDFTAEGSSLLNSRPSTDASQFASILERPLFATTRRPAPVKAAEPAAAATAPPDPLDSLRIYGVFSTAGRNGIIADVGGKPRRVLVNDSIGAWKVAAVADRDVTFSRGAETRVMRLQSAKPGVTGSAAFGQGGARTVLVPPANGRTFSPGVPAAGGVSVPSAQ